NADARDVQDALDVERPPRLARAPPRARLPEEALRRGARQPGEPRRARAHRRSRVTRRYPPAQSRDPRSFAGSTLAEPPCMISADAARELRREGNRRFVASQSKEASESVHERRAALVAGQEPFAIALGCSDSRVPAELVFDQGFGDLFVIRVAGNIVAPSQVGSVEFAAARFATRLVV